MVESSKRKWDIEIIEGEFKDDSLNGEGKIYYPDGSMYQGALKDYKKDGYGRYKTQTGQVVKGVFENDKLIEGNPAVYKSNSNEF